ncbi:MAG TPA: hypothetical protein VJ608_03040, partial [Albitalea sp.]|nr:hypothetical protein [Albitalea sp.]
EVRRAPHAFPTLVTAMGETLSPPTLVTLTGPSSALASWRAALAGRYLPGVLVLQLPADTRELPEALAKPAADSPQAWVCRGPQCLPPIDDIGQLLDRLDADALGRGGEQLA